MPDRILVVDDEEPIREIVASMLGTAGYACKQAASGMEALAVLTSGEEFELMLSDLMMADLDGIGLLERTKEKYPPPCWNLGNVPAPQSEARRQQCFSGCVLAGSRNGSRAAAVATRIHA